jgi:F-type H+-transporting ATPase subunit b
MTFFALAESSIQLVPDGTLLIHVALILVMVYVLNRTLFKPINKILDDREKRTRGQLGAAGDILQRVEEGLSKYERSLFEARAEGYKMLEHERAIAVRERQQRLEAERKEIANLVMVEKHTIQSQADEAMASIETNARLMAAEIGSAILRRKVVAQRLGERSEIRG